MIIFLIILFNFLGIVMFFWSQVEWDEKMSFCSIVFLFISLIILLYGCFHGFINHPATEGSHVGTITAIDLEGVWFRRYEIYLKSDGFEYSNGKISSETKYLTYEYEKDLVEELKKYIGKKVKLNYGHDGGYISWNSCGTYHIKSVELVEE